MPHKLYETTIIMADGEQALVVQRVFRGSRKHVLDWTQRPAFLVELFGLLEPVELSADSTTRFMPQGYGAPDEARLETFCTRWAGATAIAEELQRWWLRYPLGANTPNWDIAVGCRIEDRPGLVLVEAKANWPESGTGGKALATDASGRSRENHDRIGAAIQEARCGWQQVDSRVNISRDSHYQLANRMAFAWKLASMGVPVVLLYLGFTGDDGIRDAGEPFRDDDDWQQAFSQYAEGTVPADLMNRRVEFNGTPVWVVSRSRPVLELSPLAGERVRLRSRGQL